MLCLLDLSLHRSCFRTSPRGRVHCPLSRASSHIPLTPDHLRRHSYQHQHHFIDHPSPAFYPFILSRFERRFTVGFQPSRVTDLQATSPKRSPPQFRVVFFVEPFLARFSSFSAPESRSRSPLRGRVRRPTVLTTQRRCSQH